MKENTIETLVSEALEQFEAVGQSCAAQAREAAKLLAKLRSDDIEVSVVGQFKRGKSRLSNAILGFEIMPVGIIPITSAATRVEYGESSAEVRFLNGKTEKITFDDLSAYISEQKNKNNELGVREVLIRSKSDFLKGGITYVDTPGVGSYHKNNTETAYAALKESDAVIFLLSVDSPINQIEIDFLYNAREYAGKFYFAVNKTDIVEKGDLKDYLTYCSELISEITASDEVKLYPVSASSGEGVEALKQAILRDCGTSIKDIMRESVRKKTVELIKNAARQLDFYRKAMGLDYEELDEKFEKTELFIENLKAKADTHRAIFEIHLNELKLSMSEKIKELFGMEYSFDIDDVEAGITRMDKSEYTEKVEELCNRLLSTLSTILMYREDNAFVVVRRIEDMNKVGRKLRSIKNQLERKKS